MLSLCWFMHICLYIIPVLFKHMQVSNFLNELFIALSVVPLLGPLSYGLFAFWLLACVVKGTIKLGMRFVFFTLHPMK